MGKSSLAACAFLLSPSPLCGGVAEGRGEVLGQRHDAEQQIVQLVGVTGIRAGVVADAVDRGGVELAEVALALRQRAAQRDSAGAALFQRRIVEEGVRLRVQDLVGER